MITIKSKNLPDALIKILQAGKVPVIKASPGVGKSQIVADVAKKYKLKLIDMRLSQYDPTDMNGFPTTANGRSNYCPPQLIPIESDPVPEGYNGWLLFLDEINSAPVSVQAAAYKLVLDRMIGDHNLHESVAIVAAGNLDTDKAITNRMGTAMQSRLVHLNMAVDHKSWLNWAHSKGIDHRITSFIEFRPELLHKFDPKHSDDTFPCPRTWEFLSDIMKDTEEFTEVDVAIAAGTVGEGAAIEFNGFVGIYENLPSIDQIKADPKNIPIARDMSVRYAISGLVAHEVDETSITVLKDFVERLPAEFQLLTWRTAIKVNPTLMNTPYIKEWIRVNAKEL